MSKWNPELTEQLQTIIGTDTPVSNNAVTSAATMLDFSARSVASKLRKMGFEVESFSAAKTSTFTDNQTNALVDFVNANEGDFTFAEIAKQFSGGEFTRAQIQGKLLALELSKSVKPTEKATPVSNYSDEDVATIISMVASGSFIEEIAESIGTSVASVRGKCLSLSTKGEIDGIPATKNVTVKGDILDGIEDIAAYTVASLAEALERTERGIKTLLTRRGISISDYNGAAKAAKALAKAA